jgi:hypothetical protein
MNKYLFYVLIFLSIGLAIFNLTQVNYDRFLADSNLIPLGSAIGALAALVLLLIFDASTKIKKKLDQ